MDIITIRDIPFSNLWQQRHRESDEETRRFWDLRADEFNEITNSADTAERRELLAWLEARNAFDKDSRVLDLGCGAGRHVLEFARRTNQVTGIDISPKMVGFAKANTRAAGLKNVDFRVAPWDELDIDACGFRAAFDLVFASMSSAVCSEESLLKFHAASRGSCFLSNFIERTDLLLQRLAGRLFPGVCWPAHEGSVYFAFNVLWQHGIYADVHCSGTSWSRQWDVQTAFEAYFPVFREFAPERKELDAELMRFLTDEEQDSVVLREVHAKTAWLYWKT